MSAPVRVQRERVKGWRMPEGAVYVGRPTRWGNPYVLRRYSKDTGYFVVDHSLTSRADHHRKWQFNFEHQARAHAVRLFRKYMFRQIDLTELRGRDLACWCPLDQPCHADVLLEIANGGTP